MVKHKANLKEVKECDSMRIKFGFVFTFVLMIIIKVKIRSSNKLHSRVTVIEFSPISTSQNASPLIISDFKNLQ